MRGSKAKDFLQVVGLLVVVVILVILAGLIVIDVIGSYLVRRL